MEAVEEPPLHNSSVEGVKQPVILDEKTDGLAESEKCHKSNGVSETAESVNKTVLKPDPVSTQEKKIEPETCSETVPNNELAMEPEIPANPSSKQSTDSSSEGKNSSSVDRPTTNVETHLTINSTDGIPEKKEIEKNETVHNHELPKKSSGPVEELIGNSQKSISVEEVVIEESTVDVDETLEPCNDRVTFQTEVLVETNDTDLSGNTPDNTKLPEGDSVGILNELGQNIELTEALRASDVTDNVENNNHTGRHEVFNKEELLDILEGNNDEIADNSVAPTLQSAQKMSETQIALQQLSRLKSTKKTREKQSKRKTRDKRVVKVETPMESAKNTQEDKKEESIINVLVKDWEDEDPADETNKLLEESASLVHAANEIVKTQESTHDANSNISVDTSTSDEKTPDLNKTGEEGQPHRRLGRVIKKKVIFDPDNPDTFTKSKAVVKSKEPEIEKEQPAPKKIKTEPIVQRSTSKSPTSKLQWKKPSKPSCKQNKRLTEIDRLLMDEGAVNMIYQLTPEAPKGKKNMRTKAEFIKKIQSSTPDSKEMKFRERKKELKYEEGDAKKIMGSKQRPSLSSSVKSPTVSEDFEAHSADDSIIYRRHSSSSYSSSCMSPRRLSDVESSPQCSNLHNSQLTSDALNQVSNAGSTEPPVDVFMPDSIEVLSTEIINKDDCLSIKEKLNSKLNLALKKRKREMSKGDKPPKAKKMGKPHENVSTDSEEFMYLSITFDQKLAEIGVQKSGSKTCNVAILKELEKALTCIEAQKDISVTLITAECAMLCSDLDLRPLLDDDVEKKTNFAHEILESVRSLLQAVQRHNKLVCSGVSGRCSGVGLAIVGLSDVVLTSERATFSISQKSHTGATPLVPGVAVLTTYRDLPQSMLNDLVIFGRRLSAYEALQVGLVSRVLWPERFNEQVRSLARDIAAQPIQNVLLKKQLLKLKQSTSESTFLSSLERERDLLLEYWTSAEGQELLHTLYNTP